MLGAMDIRRPHAVAFLMIHLPLHGIPQPEFRLHQCATGHCLEAQKNYSAGQYSIATKVS